MSLGVFVYVCVPVCVCVGLSVCISVSRCVCVCVRIFLSLPLPWSVGVPVCLSPTKTYTRAHKILEGSSPARPTRLPHIPNLDPKSHTFDLDTLFNIIKAHSGLERVPRKRGFWMPFLGASPPKRSRVPRESPASPPRVPRKPQRISCESPASPLHRLRFHTRTDDCRSHGVCTWMRFWSAFQH